MAILLTFAFISGVITILSPCILPVLPIVLSGSVGYGRARPFGVLAGFVVTFTTFTLALTAIVQALGLPADTLRYVAVTLLVLLGLVMLVPKLHVGYERLTSRLANLFSIGRSKTASKDREQRAGFWSGVPVGFSLGVVWTPCVGPIMASVIGLALTQHVDSGAVLITLTYTLGTSLPMLAVMLGGRTLLNRVPGLTRNMSKIQMWFGAVMIVMGVAIGFGWERQFQNAILRAFPGYGTGLTAVENTTSVRKSLDARVPTDSSNGDLIGSYLYKDQPRDGILRDYGQAPAIVTGGSWFNTQGIVPGKDIASIDQTKTTTPPLTMEDLRGKVVLLDFWTYSCVNCVRTIPYLKDWYDTYRDQGFVIIGVHTPEFEFEKKPANVQKAIKELGINWPVVQDNLYEQWYAYNNRYWPAHYFIDADGRVRYFQFGEGEYDVAEQVIRALLQETGANLGKPISQTDPRFTSRTPEIYLGLRRMEGFMSEEEAVLNQPVDYLRVNKPSNGEWALSGKWIISRQYVTPLSDGVLELGFHASNVFLVVEPEEPGGRIEVRVDGQVSDDTADVKDGVLSPNGSRLYQLVGLEKPGKHVLNLNVKGKLRLFAFTFG
ncbi:MAG: cytochrome c biogenesis protein DipZ [Spirochaetota bacterium]|nr:MAG: cytochrome c biogenesis protein DipZ [Spirochaetota bacterium]